jgi:GNAT superfamily N-acetyltransferase
MVDVRYDLTGAHRDTLAGLYAETWFGNDWDGETVDGLLEGTDELVALTAEDSEALLAFAHVLTDYTTVAFVRDVVVDAEHRGAGLGRRLIQELRDHPELTGVDQLAVTCPDRLAPFYEACGFEHRADGAVLVRDA